jgi:alkylation response protein AidB-like acyl-CoA dehydrogenase
MDPHHPDELDGRGPMVSPGRTASGPTALVRDDAREQLRAVVRRCVAEHGGPRPFLTEQASGRWYDEALLRTLSQEVGVTGLVVAEELGGAGANIADLAVVFEELGAGLAPVPVFGTILATAALRTVEGDPVAAQLLMSIADGELRAAVAGVGMTPAEPAFSEGAEGLLTGRAAIVIEAAEAEVLLVPATTEAGESLFAVEAGAEGVTVTPLRTLDLTRGLATLELQAAPSCMIGTAGSAPDAVSTAWDLGCIILAAEQVGGAQHCFDAALDYAKNRVQFGRTIGSFQVIKHALVCQLLQVELARSALLAAVDAADAYLAVPDEASRRQLTLAASMAKAVCSDAYMAVADESLHIHGGVGFTWDHDAHIYFRRAKSSQQLLGGPDTHRERLAAAAGL